MLKSSIGVGYETPGMYYFSTEQIDPKTNHEFYMQGISWPLLLWYLLF